MKLIHQHVLVVTVWVTLCLPSVLAQLPGGGSSSGGGPMPPSVTSSGGNHAPWAIHHVGVAYNILNGNPDGEYYSTGGEDPGVRLTHRVFTVSPGDTPPEIITEHHDGCLTSHSFNLVFSPLSYQQKLFNTVKTSGTADASLKPYAFTMSSAFQAVIQQTSKHHYVIQDASTVCTLGHVRYSMQLASSDHYPVTREFAHDVCALPATYDATAYMAFIENWGTHVMTEVTIGKSNTNRYLGRLRDLFNFVMFNVTDEISMGGPLDGYQTSYVIDINSFKYRYEYKYIVGVFEDKLTIGDMYTSDVIGKTLVTIDTALDAKYWQYMNHYVQEGICSQDAAGKLTTWKTNINTALKAYPVFKQASQPAATPLQMPTTWPLGTYSMPKPQSGCPGGFMDGSVTLPQATHKDPVPTGLHLDGTFSADSYTLNYCTKEDPYPSAYDIYWPRGDYCIQQYDDRCPYAFKSGKVILSSAAHSSTTGVVPTGTYDVSDTVLQFCCRNDTVYSHKIYLPSDKSFYLFRNQHGCQHINGMSVTDEPLTFYTMAHAHALTTPHLTGSYPHVDVTGTALPQYTLHYCYYTPIS